MKKFLLALCLVSSVSFNAAADELGNPVGGVVADRRTGETLALYECPSFYPGQAQEVRLVRFSASGDVLGKAACLGAAGTDLYYSTARGNYVMESGRGVDFAFPLTSAVVNGGPVGVAGLSVLVDIPAMVVMGPGVGIAALARHVRHNRIQRVFENVLTAAPGVSDVIHHHLFMVIVRVTGIQSQE